jgi:hypothetical protein
MWSAYSMDVVRVQVELNLLGQPHQFGDACLESFVQVGWRASVLCCACTEMHTIQMFNYNVTLTKIIWRLDSRKSFAINKLIVRNNTIRKFLSEGKDVGCVSSLDL